MNYIGELKAAFAIIFELTQEEIYDDILSIGKTAAERAYALNMPELGDILP